MALQAGWDHAVFCARCLEMKKAAQHSLYCLVMTELVVPNGPHSWLLRQMTDGATYDDDLGIGTGESAADDLSAVRRAVPVRDKR